MITKVIGTLRRSKSSNKEEQVRVYVSRDGSVYVKGRELAHNAAWRAKVKKLIDADLTGRNKQEPED